MTEDGAISSKSAALAAIQQLCADYFDRADHPGSPPVAELFTSTARLQLGATVLDGAAAITAFFAERATQHASTSRTVRHIPGPVCISFGDEGRATARSTVAVFAGFGPLPQSTAPPATVFDFEDVIARGDDGHWRFESRRTDILFIGDGAANFVRQAPSQEKD